MANVDKRHHRMPPTITPERLLGQTFDCVLCGRKSAINWYQKQGAPKESVPSDYSGYWVPISFKNQCQHCTWPNEISVPPRPVAHALQFYGDEADRRIVSNDRQYYYFCLALIAISPNKKSKIEAGIASLERRLAAMSGGRLTEFHARDIMTDKFFPSDLPKLLRVKLIQDACKLVEIKEVTKFVFSGATTWKSPKDQKAIRDELFSAAFISTLDTCLQDGIMPLFNFDLVKNNLKNGWAEECVLGIRYQPLFVWMSGRQHVPEPHFIKGGSTVESKVADVIAYVTAREFDKSSAGSRVDIPTSLYGATHFASFDGRGYLMGENRVGCTFRL